MLVDDRADEVEVQVLLHGDSEMLDETKAQYSYAVPMSEEALVFGVGFTLFVLLLAELLFALLRFLARKFSSSGSSPQTT